MIIKYTKIIKTYLYVLFFCIAPFSFAAPALNIQSNHQLLESQRYHEYYFDSHPVLGQMMSYADFNSYRLAEQYQKLLDAKAITKAPTTSVDKKFLAAFKKLNISTSEQLDYLLTAFQSPIYQLSSSDEVLINLYHSVAYGSATHKTMLHNMNWAYEGGTTLWLLGNFVFYHFLKPHIQTFLNSTYANGGFPALYNPPHSYFFYELITGGDDIGQQFGHAFLQSLSCDFSGKEVRNQAGFLESCKMNKHKSHPDLENLKHDESYTLSSNQTAGLSTVKLYPAPGYFKDFSNENSDPAAYSYKSLDHVVKKIVEGKTEGALFFVLYRGQDKYQFFTIGVYQGFMSLTYVVDDHAPTPILSYLIPLKGMRSNMNADQIIEGIHSMLHQSKSSHDMVPDLQGVWMMSSQLPGL